MVSRLWGINNSSRLYSDSLRVTFLLLATAEIQVEYVLYNPGVFHGHQIRVLVLKAHAYSGRLNKMLFCI